MSDLSERPKGLSPERRWLPELWLKEKGLTSPAPGQIPRRAEAGPSPLSFAQERLWFLDQFEPDSPAYNVTQAFRLSGMLDVQGLEQSINQIVSRHEALRTVFPDVGGQPRQVVVPEQIITLQIIDLEGWPEASREPEALRLASEEAIRPFDLAHGPVLRATLIRLHPAEHILVLGMHHIVSDEWSSAILRRELATFYEAFTTNAPPTLPELPIQYPDYAVWQRQKLQGDVLETQLSYWRKQLAGAPPSPLPPTDYPRPPRQTYEGAREPLLLLPTSGLERLKALGREQDATLFMTLLAAFKVLLHRYTQQEDIVLGSPIANRNRLEVQDLIGFFLNTLVLRTDLSGDPTFRQVLARVRQVALDAFDHQDLPFEKLVAELQPERQPSRSPLFQVMVVQHAGRRPAREFSDIVLTRLGVPNHTAKFDLTLFTRETEEGLAGTLEYNTDLFAPATMQRLLSHLLILLLGILDQPDIPISRLPLLSQDERHQLQVEWDSTHAGLPARTCVHHLFEAQVERTPDAIALVYDEQTLTYRELNRRANQLAHHLQALGVGPEVLVGVCLERSLEMVIGILGILKAGGAYLPLDLAYPRDRLTIILSDAQVPILLTQESLIGTLPEPEYLTGAVHPSCRPHLPGPKVLCLDTQWDAICHHNDDNPASQVTAENLAYVIYTSGSAGTPKGVMVTHQNVTRLFATLQDRFHFDAQDVWTLFHSYAFDFSVWELWGALLHGGRLVVVPYWISRSPDAFHQLVGREGVTVLCQTPSAFRQLVRAEGSIDPQIDLALRWVILGGEALDLQNLRPWFARHSDRRPRVVNMYGITETTVHVTYRPLGIADLELSVSLVGTAIPDLQVLILDQSLQPLPIGVPGEIHVGGAGLTRGYLGRPALTAERFVPNPFSHQPGARLYRTGDTARYRPDGDIEYLGRLDHQIKIRGFRIELGEIETILAQHPSIQYAVVLVHQDPALEDQRLVAYLVPRQDSSVPNSGQLRGYLKERLPEYMVPSAFMVLDALPLTANGKLDRGALPAPDWSRDVLENVYVTPRTPVEEVLSVIWSQVLGVERVGANDSFFELGGHSLLATQVISRTRDIFQMDLPLRTIFEAPTVAAMAAAIVSQEAKPGQADMTARLLQEIRRMRSDGTKGDLALSERSDPALRRSRFSPAQQALFEERSRDVSPDLPGSVRIPRRTQQNLVPLSFAQERQWFLHELEPDSPAYNIAPAYHLSGSLDLPALEQSLNEIIRRHEALRTTFSVVRGQPVQVIAAQQTFQLPLLDLRDLTVSQREIEAQHLCLERARLPFDLRQGPLFRPALLQLADDQHILLLSMHHIVSDGWSMGVLMHELSTLYLAFSQHKPSPLPDLPIQYADYALWQRQWLQGERLEAPLAYWKEQLTGAPQVLDLPSDRPRPQTGSYEGAVQTATLPIAWTKALRDLARQEGATPFMLLLAAFQTLLRRYTGETDIVVGSPIANRTRVEIEPLIGFIINTLALRTNLSGNPTFRQLLARVRTACLAAYDHQQVPFEKLIQEMGVPRDLSQTPLFQTLFVFQNALAPDLQIPGLSLEKLEFDRGIASFDLSVEISQAGDGLHCRWKYRTELFDSATIGRMMEHYQTLLESIVTDPDERVDMLPLLTDAERRQILVEWNNTAHDYGTSSLVHELIEAEAERTPDAVAVVFRDRGLTYRELNARANQVANHLRALGIGPEVRVGVYLERSEELVIALLAILKSGGVYVPLDPDYPRERLRDMLESARPAVLLAQERLVPSFPDTSARIVCLDSHRLAIERNDSGNPTCQLEPDNLAYIVFTSGSTGKPKGVMVSHAALRNRLLWTLKICPLGPNDRTLARSPFSFDGSLRELLYPLMVGARLIVAPPDGHRDAAYLIGLICEHKLTFAYLSPSLLSMAMADEGLERCSSLEFLMTSDEAVAPELVNRILNRPGLSLINTYGPSEAPAATTWSSRLHGAYSTVLIGRAATNVQVYLLDPNLQPVPIGVPGELYIGGVGLGRGYLDRPAETAKRFGPDPFSDKPGSRLYRTGDLARYRPDGNIEFLGRIDHQVKIRGHRVELGEVQSALNQHPGVQDSAVVAQTDSLGDTN
jgi:amino acid adenylation domain-containing protein